MSTPYTSSSPRNPDFDLIRGRVIPELDKGRGYAEQLLGQLQFRRRSPASSVGAKPEVNVELVQEVMRCFTSAIAALMEPFGGWSAFQMPSVNQNDTAQATSISNKRKKPQAKERRRKTKPGETREIIKSDGYAIHDNYSWRKYGEKYINGYDFPREYFRCAYQGCLATKRVQKIQDGSPGLCLVTCQNEHSCTSAAVQQERFNDNTTCSRIEVKEEQDVQVEASTSSPYEAQQSFHVSSAMRGMQTTNLVESYDNLLASMLLPVEEALPKNVVGCTAAQGDMLAYGFQPSPTGPLDFMWIDDYNPELEEALSDCLVSSELVNNGSLWF